MGNIKKVQPNKNISGDFNDPFAPNIESEQIVICLHCGEEYKENEIKWDKKDDLWVCKNYPSCDGTGLGFDIHHKEEDDAKLEIKVIQDKNIPLNNINSGTILSTNMIPKDETFFKSKEDVFNSIICEGFTPHVEREDTDEIEGEFYTVMEVGLVCPHGHAECSRTYDKHEDGTWEYVEESFGFPCPYCES